MKKMEESRRKYVEVSEVADIWRKTDDCLYTVYKDAGGNYYMDACDGGPNIAKLNNKFNSDEEAVEWARADLDMEV